MKLISLLIAVVIVGFLLKNQLTSNSSSAEHERISEGGSVEVPDVPSAPEEVQNFEKDINTFILDNPGQRMKEAEESLDR